VAECQAEYEALLAADKAQEKAFRNRKEFADHTSLMEVLFKLFKKRPKRHATMGGEATVPLLDKVPNTDRKHLFYFINFFSSSCFNFI
jgi:hypothetical protein